jgi:NAD-dependent deacetylase sirtuin 3
VKSFSVDKLIESIKTGRYKRIIILAGAGISTPSGIPDFRYVDSLANFKFIKDLFFRTPGTGLYDNLQRYNIPYPEAIFELNYFYRNPQPFFHLAKELYPGRYFPNIIHYFIRYLHDQNILHRVYTQNIDGLERSALKSKKKRKILTFV